MFDLKTQRALVFGFTKKMYDHGENRSKILISTPVNVIFWLS
jgi:hypothetical protein